MGEERAANGKAFRYDERGRVVSETLWLEGTGYTTTYRYDSMDRVSVTVYPDGEEVAYGYADTGHGRLVEVAGTDLYVRGIVYTATQALDRLDLGEAGGAPVVQVD